MGTDWSALPRMQCAESSGGGGKATHSLWSGNSPCLARNASAHFRTGACTSSAAISHAL